MKLGLTYRDWKEMQDKLDTILTQNAAILANQSIIIQQGVDMAASGQQVTQNLRDITELAQQLFEYVVSRDAEMERLKQAAKDAIDRANIADAAKQALQSDMDAAFQASEDTENDLRAKIAGLPPVGGTPLVPSYPDRASFDDAVGKYTGPEAVNLDGNEVKSGSQPALEYFTHSSDGRIDTAGPTD